MVFCLDGLSVSAWIVRIAYLINRGFLFLDPVNTIVLILESFPFAILRPDIPKAEPKK